MPRGRRLGLYKTERGSADPGGRCVVREAETVDAVIFEIVKKLHRLNCKKPAPFR